MSLATPDKIRSLQRKLYCKAKAEPAFRFYLLYDKMCRADILVHAYRRARRRCGGSGRGRGHVRADRGAGPDGWLAGVREEADRRRIGPTGAAGDDTEAGRRRAAAGIPTIRDRVVQTAAKLVLEPIFEADLDRRPMAIGPRGALDAVRHVHRLLSRGTPMW